MQDLIAAIVHDLSAASAWLLEAGAAPAVRTVRGASTSTAWQPTLDRIREFARLLPRLIDELEATGAARAELVVASRSPKYARPSRAPRDHVSSGTRLLPVRWYRIDPVREPDPQALEWLEHLRSLLEDALDHARARIGRHLDALLADSVGDAPTEFALAQRDALVALDDEIGGAARDLARCGVAIRNCATWSLAATPRRPWPYPSGLAWARLQELAARIEDPRAALPSHLRDLLSGEASSADVPFLYQRWVALQVVETLAGLGYASRQDPVPVLFLGGRLDFVTPTEAGVGLRMWIEPRLPSARSAEAPHESGLSTNDGGEATPDTLLVATHPRRSVAYVLDPTFTTGPIEALHKGRYRSRLAFHEPRLVAGVPTRVPPARSYAAQPLLRSSCLLHDPEGRTGVVPLHPIQRELGGLRAWLGDLVDPA